MPKTLEETKAYITDLSKQNKLNDKTLNQLLEIIEVDNDGLVSDLEIFKFENTIRSLVEKREYIKCRLKQVKKLREDAT